MSARPHRIRAFGISLVAGWLFAAAASALIFNVNTVEDYVDFDTVDIDCETAPGNGICTLRAAVMQANVMPSDSTIVLPAGTYFLERISSGTDGDDTTGDLNLKAGAPVITISGAGAATTIIDANELDRVIRVHSGRTAIISGVTLRNGDSGSGGAILNSGILTVGYSAFRENFGFGAGGGISNEATLTLSFSTVQGNETAGGGGGIYNSGTLNLDQSSLSGNISSFGGGGIYSGGGTVTLDRCTISGNESSDDGGGIANYGTLFAENSTISGNKSTRDGGGIFNYSNSTVWTYNATIAFNEADSNANGGSGGGVYTAGSFYPRSSVIMGNTHSGNSVLDDCSGTLSLFGQNAFSTVDAACNFELQNDDAAYFVRSVNGLGPLQFNGGSTRTHALAAGSGLIDGGSSNADCLGNDGFALATDQRGGAKELGTLCDLGAFEFGALPAGLIFADGFELGNLLAWG